MRATTKKFTVLGLGLGLVIGMSACSPDDSSGEGGNGDSNEQITLDWGFWDQGEDGNKIWQGLADQVTEEYPNITVELTRPPFAEYFTKLQSQLAAGNTPCVMSMQSLRLPAFAKAMEPLSGYTDQLGFTEANWNPGALKALQFDGEQYAIPYGISTMTMYYNKDMFAEAGVPEPENGWTVAEFEDAARRSPRQPANPPSVSHSQICTCSLNCWPTTGHSRSPQTGSWI